MASSDLTPAQRLHAASEHLQPLLREGGRDAATEALADRVRAWFAGEPVPADRAWAAAEQLLAPKRRRLVVYTALIGAKETLADPLRELPAGASTDLELDFVCVTDNPALKSPTWRLQLIGDRHLPPEKLSRRPKALPHEYFPDDEFSLYIDNTVSFRRLPQSSDLATARPTLFKAFRHATRRNPEQEAGAVAMLGYEDVETITRQMDFIAARRPLAEVTPLTTATVLLRQHHRPEVARFGRLWWESVLAFSKRDQLSFDFARLEAGCEVEYFEGFTHENEFIRWQGSLSQHRVKASFDARRYAWLHRDDPAARADPKAHFLAHHDGDDTPYQKTAPMLEYVCHLNGSSLGRDVSPRRSVAGALEPLLAPHRHAGQRWLLLRVQDNPVPHAFAADEHAAAAKALSMYMSPAQGTLVDLPAADLQPDGKVWAGGGPVHDLVLVLGAAPRQLAPLVERLQRLVKPEGGSLVAVLTEPASLREAAEAEAWLARRFEAATTSSLQASSHDDRREPLPNTVLGLVWQRAAALAEAA
ncbi:MAG: DUF616 domain-containing protein [Rubrivivax sp.]